MRAVPSRVDASMYLTGRAAPLSRKHSRQALADRLTRVIFCHCHPPLTSPVRIRASVLFCCCCCCLMDSDELRNDAARRLKFPRVHLFNFCFLFLYTEKWLTDQRSLHQEEVS